MVLWQFYAADVLADVWSSSWLMGCNIRWECFIFFYFCVKVWLSKIFKIYVEEIFQEKLEAVLLEVS